MSGGSSSSHHSSPSASWWRPISIACSRTTRQDASFVSTSQPIPSRSMRVLSLNERIDLLEADLRADPPRISVFRDLPFALLRYDPHQEWELRRELRLLATRLEQRNRRVRFISLADLLWEAIDKSEGIAAVAELERERGYEAAQEQVTTYLSDRDWTPLPDLLSDKLRPLDPKRDVVFLIRAGAMAPALYHMSKLLDEM